VLRRFTGSQIRGIQNDGARPRAGLAFNAQGELYDTTISGGIEPVDGDAVGTLRFLNYLAYMEQRLMYNPCEKTS
jgi:hypothetical protein